MPDQAYGAQCPAKGRKGALTRSAGTGAGFLTQGWHAAFRPVTHRGRAVAGAGLRDGDAPLGTAG